jgi:hypothetical protein
MKRIAIVLLAGLAVSAHAEELTLQLLPPAEAPQELRTDFLERYLGIQRHDWKLTVPAGYSAKFIFRQKFSEQPLLEFQIPENSASNLFLVTAPDRDSPDKVQITFGNQRDSITTFMPRGDGWTLHFGNPGATKDGNLFEIWHPTYKDGALYRCGVQFLKK